MQMLQCWNLKYYFTDVCELENLVVRNNQRMSVRLHNKRRPYDTNVITLSPATKRLVQEGFLMVDISFDFNMIIIQEDELQVLKP